MSDELKEFLRVDDLIHIFKCSRTSLYNWEKDGFLPERRRIGPQAVGWLRSEIEDCIANLPKGIGAAPRQFREVQRTGKKIGRKKKRGRPRGKEMRW